MSTPYELQLTFNDALTAVYVAIGANEERKKQPVENMTYEQGGHISLMDKAIDGGIILENALVSLAADNVDYPGVFYYDVAEPFGAWIATPEGEAADTDGMTAKAEAMVREWLSDARPE